MRKLLLLSLLLPGVVNADVFAYAGGAVLRIVTEAAVVVPDVVGQASAAAADTILEGAGVDLGTVTITCSTATADSVIDQDPNAGESAEAGSLVAITTSNGIACPGGTVRPRLGRGI